MTYDAEWELREALVHGEKLLWVGRPPASLMLRPHDALLIPFSIMWTGFFVFWEAGVVSSGESLFMMLWGIPFLLSGAYFTVGRFFVDRCMRARTTYGLTPRRIIIVGGPFGRTVHSHALEHLSELRLTPYVDGTGTIDLAPERSIFDRRSNVPLHGWLPTRLERVADAREVYERVVKLQAAARDRSSTLSFSSDASASA